MRILKTKIESSETGCVLSKSQEHVTVEQLAPLGTEHPPSLRLRECERRGQKDVKARGQELCSRQTLSGHDMAMPLRLSAQDWAYQHFTWMGTPKETNYHLTLVGKEFSLVV